LCCGDFNDEADESPTAAILEMQGGEVLLQGESARWQGRFEIDRMVTSNAEMCSMAKILKEAVAGRKGLGVRLQAREVRADFEGKLRSAATFRKPNIFDPTKWGELLEVIWEDQKMKECRKRLRKRVQQVQVEVDDERADFSECLEVMFRQAYEHLVMQNDFEDDA
jgi:F0F1-type ATP synthase membrane subunit b/b'